MERSLARWLLCGGLLILFGCGDAGGGAADDVSFEGHDVPGADDGASDGADATGDVPADVPADTVADADSPADVAPDSGADADADADTGDGSGPDGEPRTCGPYPGGECGTAETCDVRSCGLGASGVCVPRPTGCDDVWDPVCGCDGTTYGNDCERLVAGAALDRAGACGSGTICGGIAGFGCPTGEVCDIRECFPAAAGTCVPRPGGCFDIWDPVCGCDGTTYGNDCDRLVAGAALDHTGECDAACKPECRADSAGGWEWVDSCTSVPICTAPCSTCSAACEAVGTRSEGWYALCSDTTIEGGCGGGMGLGRLIAWDVCGP